MLCLKSLLLASLVSGADVAPAGEYLEARSASIYAGACHYGGESVTAGAEALLVWTFDRGLVDGVSLAGVEVAAVVLGTENLGVDDGEGRRSVLYYDATQAAERTLAALTLIRAECAQALGQVIAVEKSALDTRLSSDSFRVAIGDLATIEGEPMPGRECCKMPFNVWYEPCTPLDKALVGASSRFELSVPALGIDFSRAGQNDVFRGRFAY